MVLRILKQWHEFSLNPLYTGNPKMDALANSEDADEMQHNAAFHKGLDCLLRLKQSTETERINVCLDAVLVCTRPKIHPWLYRYMLAHLAFCVPNAHYFSQACL